MTDEEAPGAVDTAIPQANNGSSITSSAVRDRKLSVVSKQYDMTGDGQLNEAEQAMRNLDQTGRGYLTNDKVYALMVEQMNLQKSVFQMKKVIIGLVVLVVILALSNLGTSFASAILAKDSTTNDQNELVSTKTGEALATDQTVTTFIAQQHSETSSTRDLEGTPADKEYIATNTQMITEHALEMLMKCEEATRTITLKVQSDSSETVKTICPAPTGCQSEFTLDGPGSSGKPTAGVLCLSADDKLWVQPDPVNSGFYIVSETEVQSTVNCDEPVCVVNDDGTGTKYDCLAVVPAGSTVEKPVTTSCGECYTLDPNDDCRPMGSCDPVLCPSTLVYCPDGKGGYVEIGPDPCAPTCFPEYCDDNTKPLSNDPNVVVSEDSTCGGNGVWDGTSCICNKDLDSAPTCECGTAFRDSSNNCEWTCNTPLCLPACTTGHDPGKCCDQCPPNPPASQEDCVSDSWTYIEAPEVGGLCCDFSNGWTYNEGDGFCSCPDGKTELDGACVDI